MVDLISLKGVGAPGLPNWSWCVPAGLSPERMPVVVQCMTQDGLRFLPTSIAAPRECRDGRLEHVELLPSENDINIAEDLWAWLTSSWQAKPDAERIVKAIGVLNDLLAAASSRPRPTTQLPWARCTCPSCSARCYAFAWIGHFGFEKNAAASFKRPIYSFVGDWALYKDIWVGRIPFSLPPDWVRPRLLGAARPGQRSGLAVAVDGCEHRQEAA